MRNILKASSAVAFAAVFAAGSALAADAKKEEEEVKKAEATEMAEAPAEEMTEEAMAEEVMEEAPPPAWVVGVSGYMEQWVGVSDVSGSEVHDGITDFRSDTEFNIDAKIEADNGMTFRAQIQVEGNAPAGVDESYLSISGGFGDIRLGAEDDVHSSMHYGVVDVGIGLNAGDVNAWIPGVSGFSTSGWKADRKGILYFSPRMQGLQVGLGYSSDAKNESTASTHNDHDSWSAAANYTGEMAGTTIGISIGHYNAGTTGEQTVDAMGTNHLCSLTRKDVAAHFDGAGSTAGEGAYEQFSAFGNSNCDRSAAAKGTVYLGSEVPTGTTADGAGDDDHFIPATTTAMMADDSTYTNFGLRVGVGGFGVSFAYAQSDSGAYKVMKTPLYYQLRTDATTATIITAPTDDQLKAQARVIAYVDATDTAVLPDATGAKPKLVSADTAGAIKGADFNWYDEKMDSLDCVASTTNPCNDAAADQLVREHTESVVKDMAGESTTMSAGVSFSEGPLGVSLGWTQEEREDNTEADAVMLSASYTLAPGVAARASIFQAEDEANGVDGTAFVGGITLNF